jgi:uncharacterized protein (TIGR03435 family)
MRLKFAAAIFVLAAVAGAQTRPEFDVASIRENKSADAQPEVASLPSGQFSARNLPLRVLLGSAFNEPNQLLTGLSLNSANQNFLNAYVVGGPPWVDSARFDLIGKAPPNTPVPTLLLMLRTLLEKEFKLKTHQESRPMDAYALTVGKGPLKLQPATASGPRACRRIEGGTDDPDAKGLAQDQAGFVCAHTTMPELAQILPRWAPAYIDRVVVDATNLKGSYDLKLVWVSRPIIEQGGLTVFDAVTNVGLKLESCKLPQPVLVIDHIEPLSNGK